MKYLFSTFLALVSVASYACSCANPGVITDEQYNYYDFIAKGIIASVETGKVENTFVVIVEEVFKQDQLKSEVVLHTSASSASCGISVREGDEWLIYASRQNGKLNVSLCSRTVILSAPGMGEMSHRSKDDLKYLKSKKGEPLKFGYKKGIYSEELGESRTLNIYLPKDYDEAKEYPVIYLLDGSLDEDFVHVAGLLQFSNFSWLNYMPEAILVGIANTDRKRDFTFPSSDEEYKKKYPTTGGSAGFIRFVEKELQPFVNSKFATNGTNMLIGQSLGGLLATEILYKKPEMFDHYFIVSPSLWYDDQSLLGDDPSFATEGFDKPLSVYVAVGNEGKVMKSGAKKLYKKAKAGDNINAQYEYLKNEDHASILHEALYRGFKSFGERTGYTPESNGNE